MKFKSIKIHNFRNLSPAFVEFGPRVNVFFGENAQGKTNFLETIFTLTHGRSFRTSENENLISHGQEHSFVEASVEKNKLNFDFKLFLSAHKKEVFVNEKKVSSAYLAKNFSTVLFSPESLSAIKSGDKERRDLVDELLLSVFQDKSRVVDDFRKLLRQRNKLLKDFKDGVYDANSKNLLFLETLTESYLKAAASLAVLRIEALERLSGPLKDALCYIFERENVDISVDYVISKKTFNKAEYKPVYDAMYNRWQELKSAEIKTGFSLVGPHKHDIRLLFDEKDSRFFCSQGQQRLLILAFKMAHIRLHFSIHGIYPILLLDDVLSELDEKRRLKLIAYLDRLNAQIFITTTENTILEYLNKNLLTVYKVENGKIERSGSGPGDRSLGTQEDLSV